MHPALETLIRSQPSPVTNGGFHVRQGPSAHQPHRLPDGKRGTKRRVLLQATAHPRAFLIPRATPVPSAPPTAVGTASEINPMPVPCTLWTPRPGYSFFSSLPSPRAGSTGAQSGDSLASTTAKGAHLPTPHRLRPEEPPGSAQPNHTPDLPPPTLFLGRWNCHPACYPGQTCNPRHFLHTPLLIGRQILSALPSEHTQIQPLLPALPPRDPGPHLPRVSPVAA